jgi:3-phosphoshikimate 1-carboxyvinyltransferase
MATEVAYPPELTVVPIMHAQGSVRLPGSKSISNRVLLMAALARGETTLTGLLDADDTRVMVAALGTLGVAIDWSGDTALVRGCAGRFPVREAELFLGNAGTAMRPLTAALAFAGGRYTLDGVARMRERPIGDLVDALNALGARIAYLGNAGYPPLRIEPASALTQDRVSIKGDVSSQFVTGLLIAAPLLAPAQRLRIEVAGSLISQPYVAMTVALMRRFGVAVAREGLSFVVPRAQYTSPGRFAIEGDASGASYFLALGVLAGGPLRVLGVGHESVQGDIAFAELLAAMGGRIDWGPDWIEAGAGGSLTAVDYDCTEIPDAAMTAAVLALFAQGRTVLRGIGSWRVKETDRIAAMATELAKLGAEVESGPDWLAIHGPADLRPAAIDTYDDHRIAMCFALAAAGGVPVTIRDPKCVAKTFPRYFDDLRALTTAPPVIAIDGPTASGKGTVAQRVAQALGFHYLDSGALYRLVALAALRADVDAQDAPALAALAARLAPRFAGDRVELDGDDVTDAIRTEEVSRMASLVAVHPPLRAALFRLQQSFRHPPGLVADGRDMGTVVFPDAVLKVFLTAGVEQRAQRRLAQLSQKGIEAKLPSLLADLRARDERDSHRAVSPLKPAEDAVPLDTSDLTIEQAVDRVLGAYRTGARR